MKTTIYLLSFLFIMGLTFSGTLETGGKKKPPVENSNTVLIYSHATSQTQT